MAIDYRQWREGDAARREAAEPLLRGLEAVRRSKPRARAEARFLRSIKTPERLIGPVVDDRGSAPQS